MKKVGFSGQPQFLYTVSNSAICPKIPLPQNLTILVLSKNKKGNRVPLDLAINIKDR